ncbi:MAG: hypothetical protein AAGL17_04195 [Cyanobacteria bacterium J06576_12]
MRAADTHADHMATPIDVRAHGLIDICADCREPLSKFWRGDAIDRQPLVVNIF